MQTVSFAFTAVIVRFKGYPTMGWLRHESSDLLWQYFFLVESGLSQPQLIFCSSSFSCFKVYSGK